MNRNSWKLKTLANGVMLSLACCFPVYADDTEIFFGAPPTPDAVHPNVLFILDTSGSMGTTVSGTGLSRMENMKLALHSVLDSVTNINVGLMRFNDPGGPILFPSTYVDEAIETAAPGDPEGYVSSSISESVDDVEEIGALMTMYSGSTHLEMAYGAPGGGGSGSVNSTIVTETDDGEEYSSGGISLWGSQWDINKYQVNGLRFQNISIPSGATINSAKIQLTAKRNDSKDMRVRFYGEDTGDAATFQYIYKDISSRPKTSAYVDWDIPAWIQNQSYDTPDLSALVQEIINRGDWGSGNDMVFVEAWVSGESSSAKRRAYTHRSSTSKAAKLTVTYAAAAPESQKVGLRFTDVAVPQGATILNASIEFVAAQSTSNAVTLTVKGVAEDDASAFGAAAGSVSMRPKTANSVAWAPAAWTSNEVYQTDDLTSVVQEIVHRSGWCGNNAMAFEISGASSDNRVAYSYDGDPAKAPVLKITYDPDSVPASGGCINEWLYYRVGAAKDDAEETISSGSVSLSGSSYDIRSSQINGARFDDIRINQGAEIMEARLQFTSKTNDTGSMTITLKGENSDDAASYTSTNSDISSRSTVGSVAWTPADWVTNGTYESPDIKSLIQPVVNRAGWASGHALALLVEASGGVDRRTYTFDSSAGGAPLLKIKVRFGGIAAPTTYTVRNRLHDLVEEFRPSGYTPIVDTLYEAALYYRGEEVLYGKSRGDQIKYGRVSHPSSYTGGTLVRQAGCTDANLNASDCYDERIDPTPVYTSPIEDQCQSSYIVLLTDGQANHNHSASLISTKTSKSCTGSSGESCGRQLVEWMAEADQASTIDGSQNIRTYTIGFNLDEGGQASAIQFLKDLALLGNGEYHSAGTASELAGVFQNIIREILSVDTTFVSPGATVNHFNRLAHRDEIYFSLFKPMDTAFWPGNLKRYGLYGSDTDATRVVDVNNDPAVDEATGYFKATAQSWWSDSVDGSSIEDGGAASKMPASRSVYTYTGSNLALAHSTNQLHETNTAITKAMMGLELETDTYVQTVLKWARGVDINDVDYDGDVTEIRQQMGDPLHSRPVIVTYGGTDASPDSTVFVATNEGFLHAMDTTTGIEKFAFIPQELLPNLDVLYKNSSAASRTYGLDGQINVLLHDVDNDLQIEPADGDYVYLYLGMRRGGRNYYALDVTDRDAPRLKWMIEGGVGDFTELAQTWSRPVVTKVKVGSTEKSVIIIAGGYDTDNDLNTVRTPDSEGRAIYIVDAETGSLIWSGGAAISFTERFADMLYSIPSGLSVVDVNFDGLADQMYVGDMGGQLWRFDIHNGNSASSLVTGAVIANLGGTDAASNRKFYYEPDVALFQKAGYNAIAITVGSGWRAHPLDTVIEDRFYMLRLTDIYGAPADTDGDGKPDYPYYTETSLYDATANIIGEGDTFSQASANASLSSASGWYLKLEESGEKVLSSPTTINNQVFFTSYAPHAASSVCGAAQGGGWIYIVDLWDATPTMNLDGVGSEDALTRSDRRRQLGRMGIPPAPKALIPEHGNPIVVVGPEQPVNDIDFGTLKNRTYWTESNE